MLVITIPGEEYFDQEKRKFFTKGDIVLELEHSLVSLSKWESIHEKPFLGKEEKTQEEVLSYILCMIVTPNTPPEILEKFTNDDYEKINDYMQAKMSATWFNENPNAPKNREVITSELIYYWMTSFNIPFECENWHLNRLFNLIKICGLKNTKQKKMSRSEILAKNRELNAQRRQQYGTSG